MSLDTEQVLEEQSPAVEPEVPSEEGLEEEEAQPKVNPVTTAAATALAAAGAAWMAAGLFRGGIAPHAVALLGVVIGGGLVLGAHLLRRGTWLQYGVLPVAVVAGAVLMAPDSGGGSASLWSLVQEALRSGGLSQPPVAFDPGWKMILVVTFALAAAAPATLAISLGRPKLGVALPILITVGTAVLQSVAADILSVAVAVVLTAVGLTLSYGAQLGQEGSLSASFELRRLLRGGAVAAGLAVLVVALSSMGFLFPQPNLQHVIPPQKPPPPQAVSDRVLFTYHANRATPLRMGVIDVYDPVQQAWLLPPYDTTRFVRLQTPTRIPGTKGLPSGSGQVTVTVTIGQASGHDMPSVPGLEEVSGTHEVIQYDPRTGTIQLADRPVFNGFTFTTVGAPVATGVQLSKAPAPPPAIASQYLAAPALPSEVQQLLVQYSKRSAQLGVPEDPFNRLTFLRQDLYSNVVAAGGGVPVDVSANRVVEMLHGGDATPFEITAAEALLARWSGVPSRIAYGYFGGEQQKDGSFEVHPRHAAMWLEVYFQGYGWVPLIGVPPHARPTTSQEQKNQIDVAAINQLQLILWIPVSDSSVLQLFEVLRWYLVRVLPLIAALALLAYAYPWPLKLLRSSRRRAWGRAHGPGGRITAAYAEFRDRARDLTIGDPAALPLEFLAYIADDVEHRELAWLVTRALWGDLRRGLEVYDADAAERLAASVSRRLDRAQPLLNRVLARAARTSFREPYEPHIPNPWFEPHLNLHLSERYAGLRRMVRNRGARRRRAAALAAGAIGISACGMGVAAASLPHRHMPDRLVPAAAGVFTFHQERAPESQYRTAGAQALVSDGRVYSVHHGGSTDGAVEFGLFKSAYTVDDINDDSDREDQFCHSNPDECPGHEIFIGLQKSIGSGQFQRTYVGGERVYRMLLPDQTDYLWFPPHSETFAMLILIAAIPPATADQLVSALVQYEHGGQAVPVAAPSIPPSSPTPPPAYGPGLAGAGTEVSPSP